MVILAKEKPETTENKPNEAFQKTSASIYFC
jgi:hypothetical protein